MTDKSDGFRLTRRGFGRVITAAAAGAMLGSFARVSAAATVPYTYGLTTAALPRWLAARNRGARVLTLGSSITYGAGSSNLVNETAGSDLAHYSWPSQLAGLLTFLGIPANANGIAFGPSGGSQGRLAGNGHTDPRVVADPAWAAYASAPSRTFAYVVRNSESDTRLPTC